MRRHIIIRLENKIWLFLCETDKTMHFEVPIIAVNTQISIYTYGLLSARSARRTIAHIYEHRYEYNITSEIDMRFLKQSNFQIMGSSIRVVDVNRMRAIRYRTAKLTLRSKIYWLAAKKSCINSGVG